MCHLTSPEEPLHLVAGYRSTHRPFQPIRTNGFESNHSRSGRTWQVGGGVDDHHWPPPHHADFHAGSWRDCPLLTPCDLASNARLRRAMPWEWSPSLPVEINSGSGGGGGCAEARFVWESGGGRRCWQIGAAAGEAQAEGEFSRISERGISD
jgi:hypothetical protein